jgi:hypothetical protein
VTGPARNPRALLAGLALLAATPGPLAALQLAGTLDLGTGAATWDQPDAEGSLTRGAADAAYRAPGILGLEPELTGAFDLTSEPAGRTAMHWDLSARLHTRGERTGGWLGAAVGAAGMDAPSAGFTRLEGGLRHAWGPAGVDLWVTRTSYGSPAVIRGGLGQGAEDTLGGRHVSEYTDLGSSGSVGVGGLELGLTLIRRLGGAPFRRTGWEVNAVWWLAPSMGLVGAAGHSLPQLGAAIPGARYGMLGLRLALGTRSSRRRPVAVAPPAETATTTPRLVAGPRRITISGRKAGRAEVMGDFTDWQPVRMQPAGEARWILPVTLAPGAHHLNVRFDGGPWLVPAGAVPVDDGFGSRAGLFVVPAS